MSPASRTPLPSRSKPPRTVIELPVELKVHEVPLVSDRLVPLLKSRRQLKHVTMLFAFAGVCNPCKTSISMFAPTSLPPKEVKLIDPLCKFGLATEVNPFEYQLICSAANAGTSADKPRTVR